VAYNYTQLLSHSFWTHQSPGTACLGSLAWVSHKATLCQSSTPSSRLWLLVRFGSARAAGWNLPCSLQQGPCHTSNHTMAIKPTGKQGCFQISHCPLLTPRFGRYLKCLVPTHLDFLPLPYQFIHSVTILGLCPWAKHYFGQ
jgi:hypothetical protein